MVQEVQAGLVARAPMPVPVPQEGSEQPEPQGRAQAPAPQEYPALACRLQWPTAQARAPVPAPGAGPVFSPPAWGAALVAGRVEAALKAAGLPPQERPVRAAPEAAEAAER